MSPTTPIEYSPMRAGLFRRWLMVWHVLYIGGLLTCLVIALWSTRGAWGAREAALVGVVAVLIAVYARVLIFETRWPYPNWFLAVYFCFCLALLGLAAWLNPVFIYVIGMLFGQMFGIMPPVLVLPGIVAVLAVILLASNDFRLVTGLDLGDGLFIGAQIGLMMLLYLYIYHVFRTSQERAGLVNELRAAQAELERSRAAEVELAALRERERVARDLHDGLGHSLVALSVQLEAVQRLYPVDPARASAHIDDMKRLTRESMAELRRTLDDLRAPGLEDESLAEALERLCADLAARTGLAVERRIDAPAGLPPAVAEALWRVAQEALANVERHAGATAVRLALVTRPDAVTLTVSDDGRGLPPDAEGRPGHYGLRGVRERVEGLGGALMLARNGGTTVEVSVPI